MTERTEPRLLRHGQWPGRRGTGKTRSGTENLRVEKEKARARFFFLRSGFIDTAAYEFPGANRYPRLSD